MMRIILSYSFAATLVFTAPLLGAQTLPAEPAGVGTGAGTAPAVEAPALSAEVTAKLLARVEKMQKDFDQQKRDVLTSAIARLSSAAASDAAAIDLYLACRRMLADRSAAAQDAIATKKPTAKDARAVDKRQDQVRDNLEEPGHGAVLRLQAEYLMITLEAEQSKDPAALVSRVRDFVNKAMGIVRLSINAPVDNGGKKPVATIGNKNRDRDQDKERQMELLTRARRKIPQQLQQSVMSTVFAQAYNLANYHKKIPGWVDAPLSLDRVYTSYILPHYRATRRADLVGVWDEYLGHSLAMQRAMLDDAPFARWGITDFKQLQWEKWSDLLLHGSNPSVASDELASLFHDNPSHPAIAQWLEGLKALAEPYKPVPVAPAEPTEASAETPAAAAATPASGTPEAPFKF
jgi:hypothetical protein